MFLDLKRKGYHIYVGRILDKEVDFIAEKNNNRIYIQVTYLLSDERVIRREFGNLEKIRDNYPKYVISLDELKLGNIAGIKHQQAWNFIS